MHSSPAPRCARHSNLRRFDPPPQAAIRSVAWRWRPATSDGGHEPESLDAQPGQPRSERSESPETNTPETNTLTHTMPESMTTNVGEEFAIKQYHGDTTPPQDTTWLLFNNTLAGGDNLTPESDIEDVTTEPDGNDYSRITYSWADDTHIDISGGDPLFVLDPDDGTVPRFEAGDATQSVDSWGLVVTFLSERAGDGSASNHLLSYGPLGDTYDLDKFRNLDVEQMGQYLTGQL